MSVNILKSGERNADLLPACEVISERCVKNYGFWPGLVKAYIVDGHALWEHRIRSDWSTEVAANCDVHQDKEGMVENPLFALQKRIIGGCCKVLNAIDVPDDPIRLPLD